MQRAEVVAGDRLGEHTAQRLAAAALGSDAGAKCMGPAERCDRAAAFIASTGPHVSDDLAGERANCALVLEAVTMFVRTLATCVVAIEAWATRAAGDGEVGGAP